MKKMKTFTLFYHLGVMPRNSWKLMPGIGRESTDKYSSLKRLFMLNFNEISDQENCRSFSMVILLIKYSGSCPEREISLLDMV